MARRTAGRLGLGGGPWILFFPSRLSKAAMLKEGIGDHRHEGMTMQALPRSSLEVIEPQFLFQLLVRLLANPSCLDRGGQGAQVGVRWQIAQIVLLLAAGAVLADEPGFVARHMLRGFIVDTSGRVIGRARARG